MTTTGTLNDIKVMSATAFSSVTTTDDNKLYFVEEEESGGTITEYSSGTSGYLIFPDGICIQWGQVSATTSGATVALSKTYTNKNYATFAAAISTSRSNYSVFTTNSSTSQIKIGCYTACSCWWMTIGQLASGQY